MRHRLCAGALLLGVGLVGCGVQDMDRLCIGLPLVVISWHCDPQERNGGAGRSISSEMGVVQAPIAVGTALVTASVSMRISGAFGTHETRRAGV
jgi:hypothetical protein